MEYLDFAPGYKTIAGLVVLILSTVFRVDVPETDVLALIAGVGQLVGIALTVYGLAMKIYRKYQESRK